MKTPIQLVFALFFALLACPMPAQEAPKWAHQGSDLKADPAITYGELKNGVRWAIKTNAEPPERVSIRLFVDAGSLMENDAQQGLAHFLEHMAFNGTRHFPAGEMVEYFQRLGMAFGADTNAHTSFDETVYKLELPKGDDELMNTSLQLLRDYADGMLLEEKEIKDERGVILSEKLSRDSVQFRTMIEEFKFSLPESIIPNRLPIGTEEVIKGAPRERFKEFYEKWYTADRLAVVVVGEVDPKKTAALIAQYFGSLKPPAKRVPNPDLGKVTTGRGLVTKLHYEDEAGATDISLETIQPDTRRPDTAAKRAADLKLGLANAVISRRLGILAKEEGAKFQSGSARAQSFMDFVKFGGVYMTCKPENWEGALQTADQELRRALEHGFTEAELSEAKANVLNAYEEAAERAGTRRSRPLADGIVSSISNDIVITSPADDLERAKPLLESITAEQCLAALRELWKSKDRQIFVGGNLQLDNADAKIGEVYLASVKKPVDPPEQKAVSEFAYTDFGQPGEIVEDKTHEDLAIRQLRFANDVRVNLKQTDFEDNSIGISVRLGSGKLTAPKDKPGLGLLAGQIFQLGGLEKHSVDDIQRIFAGKTVGGGLTVGDDAFTFSGGTNQEDLLDQLQLMAAYITAPGYRPESLRMIQRMMPMMYQQLAHTPGGVFQDKASAFLHGGDYRFGFPPLEELSKRSIEDVKAWIGPDLKDGYMEISVVGDFDPTATVAALAKTFGALPNRKGSKPRHEAARLIELPSGVTSKNYEFDSEIPKALSAVLWPTADLWDMPRTRRLNVLSSIFSDRLRLKIREELGEAYSPGAQNMPSDTYKDYGFLMANVTVEGDETKKIGQVMRDIGTELHAKGANEDELVRAIKPILSSIDQQLRSNGYWLGTVLNGSQENPQRLDWARSMKSDYESIKIEEVNALAKEYLKPEQALSITVAPTAPKEAEKSATEAK